MHLSWSCAMCGKETGARIATEKPIPSIVAFIKKFGWIVEKNGCNTDIYCSKKCAR
jgi:hypothetical protein